MAALALLAFAQLISALDYTIVYVALPHIGTDLGFSAHDLQWVVSAYLVTFGGTLLLGGRACDLLGRRRMFVASLVVYAAASAMGGLATTPGLLIGARAVQGVGGAFLFPATLSLVTTTFPEGRERNRALALWGVAGSAGLCAGSLLGGLLTGEFGWSAVFWVNVPLAGGAALVAPRLLPPDPSRVAGRGFDVPGGVAATAALTLLVSVLVEGPAEGWTAPTTLAAGGVAAACAVAFAAVESRTRDPLVPLRLLRNRGLAAGMAVTFMFLGTFGTTWYVYTVYFTGERGYSPLRTGVAFLLPAVVIAAGTLLGEPIADRLGLRSCLFAGCVLGAFGAAEVAWGMARHGTYAVLLPGLVTGSFGQGMVWTSMWTAAVSDVAAHEQGVASAMASTSAQVGGAVGLAALVAVADAGDGVSGAMYCMAAVIVLSSTLALCFPHRTSMAPL